jgi:hypothetical protein
MKTALWAQLQVGAAAGFTGQPENTRLPAKEGKTALADRE